MTKAIERSPLLTAFGIQVRLLRGRFYLDRRTPSGIDVWGRITPIAESKGELLLEVERRSGSWSEIANGSALKLVNRVANDTQGTFHGLGSLEKSLRKAGKGLTARAVKASSKAKLTFVETGEACSVQEALFHFFGLPVEVIAQPARWYSYRRSPKIVEFSKDRTKVLVRFSATSMSGEDFGGTCLYLLKDGEWQALTIRPNASQSIGTAEKWLVMRKWKPWC